MATKVNYPHKILPDRLFDRKDQKALPTAQQVPAAAFKPVAARLILPALSPNTVQQMVGSVAANGAEVGAGAGSAGGYLAVSLRASPLPPVRVASKGNEEPKGAGHNDTNRKQPFDPRAVLSEIFDPVASRLTLPAVKQMGENAVANGAGAGSARDTPTNPFRASPLLPIKMDGKGQVEPKSAGSDDSSKQTVTTPAAALKPAALPLTLPAVKQMPESFAANGAGAGAGTGSMNGFAAVSLRASPLLSENSDEAEPTSARSEDISNKRDSEFPLDEFRRSLHMAKHPKKGDPALSEDEIARVRLFTKDLLPKYIAMSKRKIRPREERFLPRTIEVIEVRDGGGKRLIPFLALNRKAFLVNDPKFTQESCLDCIKGEGATKKAKFAINLITGKLHIRLSCEYDDVVRQELKTLLLLNGENGIVKTDGFLFFTGRGGKQKVAIYQTALTSFRETIPKVHAQGFAATIQYAVSCCMGLETMHTKKLVHRDVKPSNMGTLVDNEGRHHAQLLDFGITRCVNSFANQIRGTWMYYSPELFEHRDLLKTTPLAKYVVRPEADIWALGIMFYQLFHQKEPYPASAVASPTILRNLLYSIRNRKFESLVVTTPDKDARNTLIVKMLSFDPAKRPTITQVREALEKMLKLT